MRGFKMKCFDYQASELLKELRARHLNHKQIVACHDPGLLSSPRRDWIHG